MAIINVKEVSKTYRRRHGPRALLGREGVGRFIGRRPVEVFAALQGVSFDVEAGEAVGIIGQNGSGKSTLLKIIAGVTLPTTGEVTVHVRIASLLELGAGFHPMLTGRENVYLNAALLGLRHTEVDSVFDRIVEFSGIGPFIENPVDTYSSGMYVRLAFSVAVHTDPDVFLVDEVLAVGDEEFQRKCRRRIGELREQGKTILFVSHDLGIVSALCDRVLLLSRGKLISRDTPQQTIDFYLRTVGGAEGMHILAGEETEAISSHGQVSLFHRRLEASAPAGFSVNLRSYRADHTSSSASWTVVEAMPDSAEVRGQMPRLPIAHAWRLRIEDGRLEWKLALECDKACRLDSLDVLILVPTAYSEWVHGDLQGPFPEITPEDTTWHPVVTPEVGSRQVAALPRDSSPLPPLYIEADSPRPYVRLSWSNTDYVSGSRALRVGLQFPDDECRFEPGRHELVTLTIDPTLAADDVRRRVRAERTLQSEGLTLLFEHGMLRISVDGEELTAFLHIYTSILIGNLWNDSFALQWEPLVRTDDRMVATGRSRRFPFRQRWTVEPVAGGVEWCVSLEALEDFEAQEYHASAVLSGEYTRWRTDHESGAYPRTTPGREEWSHVNRTYTPGRRIQALSDRLPSVTLESVIDEPPFRMTAINTGHSHGARVLQALRVPEAGFLRFEKGEHLYFSGRILVGPSPVQEESF